MLPQTVQSLAADGQPVATAPVAASALSFVFALKLESCDGDVPSDQPGTQLVSLNLTPNMLAGIFLGQTILNDAPISDWQYAVPQWNMSSVLALNPTLGTTCGGSVTEIVAGGTGAEQIFPIGRQDAVPENQALASFFAEATPTIWNLYLSLIQDPGYTPSDQFPWDASSLTSNGYLAQDETNQLEDLLGGNNDAYPTPYDQTVTYLATGDVAKEAAQFTAAGFTPAFVNLVPNSVTSLPASGVTPLSPTTSTVVAGLQSVGFNADGTAKIDYSFSDPAVWPIPLVSYLTVPTAKLPSGDATRLAELLNFAVSATGQADLSPTSYSAGGDTYGFTPLTGPLQPFADRAVTVANAVLQDGVKTPATTTSLARPTTTVAHSSTATTTAVHTTTPTTAVTSSTATTAPSSTATLSTQNADGSGFLGGGSGSGGFGSGTGVAGNGGAGTTVAAAAARGSNGSAASAVAAGRRTSSAAGRGAAATPSTARSVTGIRFLAEGSPLKDHPSGSLLDAGFGAVFPWLILLGAVALGAGYVVRRREKQLGLPGTGS